MTWYMGKEEKTNVPLTPQENNPSFFFFFSFSKIVWTSLNCNKRRAYLSFSIGKSLEFLHSFNTNLCVKCLC